MRPVRTPQAVGAILPCRHRHHRRGGTWKCRIIRSNPFRFIHCGTEFRVIFQFGDSVNSFTCLDPVFLQYDRDLPIIHQNIQIAFMYITNNHIPETDASQYGRKGRNSRHVEFKSHLPHYNQCKSLVVCPIVEIIWLSIYYYRLAHLDLVHVSVFPLYTVPRKIRHVLKAC